MQLEPILFFFPHPFLFLTNNHNKCFDMFSHLSSDFVFSSFLFLFVCSVLRLAQTNRFISYVRKLYCLSVHDRDSICVWFCTIYFDYECVFNVLLFSFIFLIDNINKYTHQCRHTRILLFAITCDCLCICFWLVIDTQKYFKLCICNETKI